MAFTAIDSPVCSHFLEERDSDQVERVSHGLKYHLAQADTCLDQGRSLGLEDLVVMVPVRETL